MMSEPNTEFDWLSTVLDMVGITSNVTAIIVTVIGIVVAVVLHRKREDWKESEPDPTRPLSDAEQKARAKYLRNLKENMENWIKASIHNARFMDLDIDDTPSATLPWIYRDTTLLRTFDTIEAAFEDKATQRRLLILGAPGSGKTTTLIHLARKLLIDAENDPEAPVPLLVNLSKFRLDTSTRAGLPGVSRLFPKLLPSTGGARPTNRDSGGWESDRRVEEWLAGELSQAPSVSPKIASHWLREGRVAVLLDGLDEVDADDRDGMMRLLNETFFHNYPEAVVLCSRIDEYQPLQDREETKARLNCAVTLQPLSRDRIDEYLDAAKAEGLREALLEDKNLYEMAQTPLTLSMMVLAYGGAKPEDIPAEASLTERRHHLFETYVEKMLQRKERRDWNSKKRRNRLKNLFGENKEDRVLKKDYRYPPEKHDRYLGWLAVRLSIRMQTAFSPRGFYDLLSYRIESDRDAATHWAIALAWAAPIFLPVLFALGLLLAPTTLRGVAAIIGIGAVVAILCGFGQRLERLDKKIELEDAPAGRGLMAVFWGLGITFVIINGWPFDTFGEAVFGLFLFSGIFSGITYLCGKLLVFLDARLTNTLARSLLSFFLYPILVLFRRLPARRARYFAYAKDAQLLKRGATGEMEFVHRLLRDYFARLKNEEDRKDQPTVIDDWNYNWAKKDQEKLTVIKSLGNLGEAGIDPLTDFVRDKYNRQENQEAAISEISKIPSPEVIPTIEQLFIDTNPTVRRAAVTSAINLPKDHARQIIRDAFFDPAPEVREKAAGTLARLEKEVQEELATEFARDPEFMVQQGVVESTTEFNSCYRGESEKRHHLFGEMLRHNKNSDRLLALLVGRELDGSRALVGHLPDWAKDALPALLDHQDAKTRHGTLASLGKLRDDSRLDRIMRLLREDSNHAVRRVATETLGALGTSVAVDPLMAALSDKSEEYVYVRLYAARALGKLKAPQSLQPLLQAATSDQDEDVRYQAAEASSKLDQKAAAPILIELACNAKKLSCWSQATNTLGGLDEKVAVPALIKLIIKDPNVHIMEYTEKLKKFGDAAVSPLIELASRQHSPEERRRAIRALGYLENKTAVSKLIQATFDRENVRKEAMWSLHRLSMRSSIKLGDADALALIDLTSDQDPDVRQRAAYALRYVVDNKKAVSVLNWATFDRDKHVRREAIRSLRQLGESRWLLRILYFVKWMLFYLLLGIVAGIFLAIAALYEMIVS
uniref:HEAT repeat n=1 Tax=Candidatus Kentrum sp. UNK TaxID=2126344 RepID=A0A451AZ16_9GAMM|nr:MAG: HEAT repeat [Candidatus Kentron sp. UNK]VFK71302.1 MAG: HEAT repeat [Candidatus Kentron sp. UNK]